MASHKSSTVRAAALRKWALSLEKAISIGLKSGLQGERNLSSAPLASMIALAEARRAVVERECAGDQTLKRDVERLLAHDAEDERSAGRKKLAAMAPNSRATPRNTHGL